VEVGDAHVEIATDIADSTSSATAGPKCSSNASLNLAAAKSGQTADNLGHSSVFHDNVRATCGKLRRRAQRSC
jgi:hypothetical protein